MDDTNEGRNEGDLIGPIERYTNRWSLGFQSESQLRAFLDSEILSPLDVVNVLRTDIKFRWRCGRPAFAEAYVRQLPGEQPDPDAVLDLIYTEYLIRQEVNDSPDVNDYCVRFPEVADVFRMQLALNAAMNEKTDTFGSYVNSPASAESFPLALDPTKVTEREPIEEGSLPQRLGRYLIKRQLGKGGFGVVYLAYDPQLDRSVALKVPRRERFRTPEQVAEYIQEARTTAKLKHPLLVTIHDVQEEAGLPFIVQEYIEGENLAEWSAKHQPSFEQIVQVLLGVAEALGYAHGQRLTHCDLKLANVLMDQQGQPHVADFGLAVHESSRLQRKGARFGTPTMMAPEQVRGEGHRLDGRTDIWALGVMMYQMLVSQRPFSATEQAELFNEIETLDPRPPRQIDRRVPRELERICLKCLSKRRTDRYNTMDDLREELQLWLLQDASTQVPLSSTVQTAAANLPDSDSSSKQPVKIIPKGLRSFDAEDTDFFLELLPGPRDRGGLPESIRFWKNRIEESDPDKTFSVGLIYGPSGCGKSSLVKAGLLPRLSDQVLAIYVEATADETELRILKQFRKHIPRFAENISLPEACAALRRSGAGRDRKVLVVIDQFEQWLHAHTDLSLTDLVSALRQCDGGRLQFILLVRDDFFASVNRLFRELEDPLVEGRNYALVDRFDRQHARKVLTAFGRAYGKLDDTLSMSQEQFVSRAVDELVEEDKVISVRLSLFADMMKTRPWTLNSLTEMGGVGGVGVTFLEETFSGKAAPPTHREHQTAIRLVLKALLPESGTDIKGTMRSSAELLEASGYGIRPRDFDDLIRILDSEIRLITPTDPEGMENGEVRSLKPEHLPTSASLQTSSFTIQTSFYQLTHDYLVHSLREWLTRKQKETRMGRAELKLLDISMTWNAKLENRFLPSLVEWLNIRTLTDRKRWTASQRAMICRADRFHLTRLTISVVLVGLVTVSGFWTWHRLDQNRRELLADKAKEQEATRIEGLVGRLVSAEPSQLPDIIRELDMKPEVALSFLKPLNVAEAKTVDEKRTRLHARLAMISRDASLVQPLVEELLTGRVTYVLPIRQMLRSQGTTLTESFRSVLRDKRAEPQRRFRAAIALADFVPASEAASWSDADMQFVSHELVSSNAEFQPLLREALRPIREKLLPELELIFSDKGASETQRLSAANAFADYAASNIAKLTELLTFATSEQYAVLYPIVASSHAPATVEDLYKIAATVPAADMGSVARVPYGRRRANAAVTLLRLGEREKVLSVFEMTDDPEALTQFIFRCRDRDVRAEELLECLRIVSDGSVDRYPRNTRYALLLALGEYALTEIPESKQRELVKELGDWYRDAPSSGVHNATGWLLRKWGQAEIVRAVDQTPIPYSVDREWFTLAITVTPSSPLKPKEKPTDKNAAAEAETTTSAPTKNIAASDEGIEQKGESDSTEPAKDEAKPRPLAVRRTFYYTFVVFPAGDYEIGSVGDEPGLSKDETRHPVVLTRPFALLDREITFEELIAFSPKYAGFMQQNDVTPSDAGFGADWYDAVGYCRWLGAHMGLSEADQAYASPDSLNAEQFSREPNPSANWAPRNWPLELERRGFRLPTESEWEVASRAGSRTAYGYGSDVLLLNRFGWFQENSGNRVHPPRALRPSRRGVFDLHGNLFEWTHDWYGDYGVEAITDPLRSQLGSYRVARGGSWFNGAADCRTSYRYGYSPTDQLNGNGVRVALSLSGVSDPGKQVKGAQPAIGVTAGASAEQRPERP